MWSEGLNDRLSAAKERPLTRCVAVGFFHLFGDLGNESIKIRGMARRNDALSRHRLVINPATGGIDHVGADRKVGCHFASFDGAGLDKQCRRVAHRSHYFAHLKKRFDDRDSSVINTQGILEHQSAWQNQGIIFADFYLFEGRICRYGTAPVIVSPALDFTGFWRSNVYLCALCAEFVSRPNERRFL